MSIEGWYYLHINGDLIYKRDLDGGTVADIRESDFAVGLWPFDSSDREGAWRILVEALAAGADKSHIMGLAKKWYCDDTDADIYAKYIGCELVRDGNAWCATAGDFVNLQASLAGFGNTKLEAMAELAKVLGYKPSKMWGRGFGDILKEHQNGITSVQAKGG